SSAAIATTSACCSSRTRSRAKRKPGSAGRRCNDQPPHLEKSAMKRDLGNDDLNSLLPDVQVDRRGFVAACLAAGFAVTAEPVLGQAIKTSMDGLHGGDVKIGDIPAYYAVPKGGGKHPVVLVVAEIGGLQEHIKDVCGGVAKD